MFLFLSLQTTHEDLKGRAIDTSVSYPTGVDDNGHGTHVAGVAAGKFSGVCKKCQVICVKAMNMHGSAPADDIVRAINYVIEEHRQQSAGSPAVAVLSLAGIGKSTLFDRAVTSLAEGGVVPVVAAANSAADACLYTPARAKTAITVGASDLADSLVPASNWGNW